MGGRCPEPVPGAGASAQEGGRCAEAARCQGSAPCPVPERGLGWCGPRAPGQGRRGAAAEPRGCGAGGREYYGMPGWTVAPGDYYGMPAWARGGGGGGEV